MAFVNREEGNIQKGSDSQESNSIQIVNEHADYLFYQVGANIVPVDTKNKTVVKEWKIYQSNPLPEELHEARKSDGSYAKGIAIILGILWRGKNKGLFLNGLDCDNRLAIDELLCVTDTKSIEDLSQWTLVEGHKDDPNKLHIYFLSTERPFKSKSSSNVSKEMHKKINENEIPAIEVKSSGKLLFCSPSVHRNGCRYEILGTRIPAIQNEIEKCIDNILSKYGISYLAQTNISSCSSNSNDSIPIERLFEKDFRISEGHNRHEALLRVMESLLTRLKSIIHLEQIKILADSWNQEHCDPPLNDSEFDKQWYDAKNFISRNKSGNEKAQNIENEEIEYLKDIKERYISIFYDQLNRLYVTIKINDHIECIPLDGKRFKSLVRKEVLDSENKTINDDKIDRIVKAIEAEMVFDESIERNELSLRIAGMQNETIYYDLTNQKWEILRITSRGWKIIKDNLLPLFKRYENNVKPQLYPIRDDNNEKYFKEFLNLFNLGSQKDRLLLETYLISLFIPDIQKAILVISGNGGGAKTTIFSLIKNIIDPSTIDTLSFSPIKNDLIQSLEHNYVSYFDNVSYISQEVSDILCRAVTGSGNSKRAHYTNDDDFLYKFKRCIGVNGINLVTTRPDFIDRSLILKVKRIPEEKRKKEEDIKKEFERLRPYVLGYIFDVLVKYLDYKEKHKDIIIKNPPRMADFAESCEIISRCLGYPDNAFINAYRENIDNQNDEIIEASPIAEALITFMENKTRWIGTPTQLYQFLGDIVSQVDLNIKRSIYWPKGPNRLTYKINEIVPNLLKRNTEIVTGEKIKGQRVIIIRRTDPNQSSDMEDQNSLSDSIFEPLSSYINLNIHRRGSSDIFECEKCFLTGDIHLMKQHPCKKDSTILGK